MNRKGFDAATINIHTNGFEGADIHTIDGMAALSMSSSAGSFTLFMPVGQLPVLADLIRAYQLEMVHAEPGTERFVRVKAVGAVRQDSHGHAIETEGSLNF